ncbi:branched-chain amino acid ABC transporter permease [Sneathiella sp. HT1-7]|jgi:branched-chain amino acid transport system permease protein|uniref:branched-chain amino acid ABC transporter permease n=1 Tax=Sneathiella sp. HT1-7 TaxID=2887192 RepID=UPI001D1426DE|nr:branched-chain amino acid ABC transporter permease [Sneathiella sp. HT1-7]MCC3304417.1 branched-chain amino acid ABC transporter permease [Sneathiella sp. HT1-7]
MATDVETRIDTKLNAGAKIPFKWVIPFIVIGAVLPFILGGYATFQGTLIMIYAIAILGLNLLTGFNGQFSLGHSAFYAIGAYTAAILVYHLDWPVYAAIPVGGVVCFIAGFLFGLPALRLEGLYLALATFALGVSIPQVLKSSHLEGLTGGVQGLDVFRPDVPAILVDNFGITMDQWWYMIVFVVLLFMFWIAWNLINSRTGRAMMAIRDNPIAARSMGVNASMYKSLTFGVSAFYTGVAGAIAAIVIEFVAPDSFTFQLSILLFIGMVVGGTGSIWGAVFGGFFILTVPNFAEEISTGLSYAIFGIILILVIYVMPSGFAGLVNLLRVRIKKIL